MNVHSFQEELIKEALTLPSFTPKQLDLVEHKQDALVEAVNQRMASDPHRSALIGDNALEKMFNNHQNHLQFMLQVWTLNDYTLLVKTLPWVYRTYRDHGFSLDYFPAVLNAWLEVYRFHFSGELIDVLNTVYAFMLRWHPALAGLISTDPDTGVRYSLALSETTHRFVETLVSGKYREALELAGQQVQKPGGLESFYLDILQPALYQVGKLWQNSEIAVAEEHLATAIVNRIMAALYAGFPPTESTRGYVMVASSPHETHEVGGRIVADFLEFHGWNVDFIGGNIPHVELIARIHQTRPFFVALSVTMPLHIVPTMSVIRELKNDPQLQSIQIMVGGLAFRDHQDLWVRIGADGWASNAREAVELAEAWWKEAGSRD